VQIRTAAPTYCVEHRKRCRRVWNSSQHLDLSNFYFALLQEHVSHSNQRECNPPSANHSPIFKSRTLSSIVFLEILVALAASCLKVPGTSWQKAAVSASPTDFLNMWLKPWSNAIFYPGFTPPKTTHALVQHPMQYRLTKASIQLLGKHRPRHSWAVSKKSHLQRKIFHKILLWAGHLHTFSFQRWTRNFTIYFEMSEKCKRQDLLV